VDTLAQHVVGPIVRADRTLDPLMADWLVNDNLWLGPHRDPPPGAVGRRHGGRVAVPCLPDAGGDREFFLRKAIERDRAQRG
jgi:hypothetical protein